MDKAMLPFNIELLKIDDRLTALMKPVKSLDYYENVDGSLHEDGLFSISIFGRMGDEARDRRFSYIDLRTTIFHPVIYRALIKLKGLYKGIMAGTAYATWNAKERDFENADELSGKTGFQFFLAHWKDIKFRQTGSAIRDQRIKLIEKYKDRALTDKALVLPAGLRDIEVDDSGRRVVGDINKSYQKLLAVSRTIAKTDSMSDNPALNLPRHLQQMTFNTIYETLEKMLSGKRGFIQSKWGSRRVFNGTRNVISAMDTSTDYLGGPKAPKFTDTILGLYQATRALLPVTIHALKTGYLERIFAEGNGKARVVDPETLHGELVDLSSQTYDRWTTVEGLEKVVASYGEKSLRDKPVLLDGYYLALIYVGPDNTFKVFSDINELPVEFDRKYVRPITLLEIIYLSGYRIWNDYYCFVTRYPITDLGSCYPSTLYVKTTVNSEVRQELGDDWQPLGPEYQALEFPTYNPPAYLDSQVVSSTRLAGLGADFQSIHRSPTAERQY